MRAFLYALLTFIFLIQCEGQNVDNNPEIKYIINAFDVEKNQMEVSFELTNSSDTVWNGGDWSLHWNQFSGSLQQESLPEGIDIIATKNSQYWQLEFGSSFSLKPGDKLKFSGIQKGIMRRLVMGPIGFFVNLSSSNQLFDLESEIIWESALGVKDLKIPSASERYAYYEDITSLPKSELHWVIPTPKKSEWNGDYLDFPKSLTFDFRSFEKHAEFLKTRLKTGLDIDFNQTSNNIEVQITEDGSFSKDAYTIEIKNKKVFIKASAYSGLFYAIGSLHQILVHSQSEGNGIPLLRIEDSPRFEHRGFMIDLSRNFFPKKKLLQILDYMAYYKLNVLDARLSDDEGWRIEIPGLEELTKIGSNRGYTKNEKDRLFPMYGSGSGKKDSQGNGYLSRSDFTEILRAAKKRNIRVVPQVSFPSHARAAVIAMKVRYENLLEKGDFAAANEFRLHDPNDASEYISAQLFKDNTICICEPGAFRFFEKVFTEIKSMYTEVNLPMKTFNIGADELPFGVWQKSPICEEYLKQNPDINTYQSLYDESVKRLNKIISDSGAQMAGWEDVLLTHSEKSQSEIEVNENLFDLDFVPSVWNNSWGEGREDMIYKLNNLGFQAIMSNSAAFYFDMTDDMDMENSGLSWSGYVNYIDSWGTEPLNVFANKVKLQSLGIKESEIKNKVSLMESARSNFLGIQSQLWTETAANTYEFDRMLMPNMIIFSERAWGKKEEWLKEKSATNQKPLLKKSWNRFANTVGQRQLPLLSKLNKDFLFDLPKPGAIIEKGILKIRQQFPGLEIRYTIDGKNPRKTDLLFTKPIEVNPSDKIVVRLFDLNGRGGNSIKLKNENN